MKAMLVWLLLLGIVAIFTVVVLWRMGG